MQIQNASFLKSSTSISQCPPPELPEFAFIGRSNVGKSSLINMLAGRKNLAKTSGTPGKTRLINHFVIDESWYLVDLPGYGFARISKKARAQWEKMIKDYLKIRRNLICIFLLVDVRLSQQAADLEMMDWISEQNRPFVIIFTKSDKLSRSALAANVDAYNNYLKQEWTTPPLSIVSSSSTKMGKEEILFLIKQQIKTY